jgi:uncharacterized SAM-binding protein YcdF (DUF218 family)
MKKYDTVIVIPDEGYITGIYDKAVKIYNRLVKKGKIPLVIVSGATRDPIKMGSYGFKKYLEKYFQIITVERQIERLKAGGVCGRDIYYESSSLHTRQNALYSLKVIKRLKIQTQTVYVVGSFEVMLRKYLTFKKAGEDVGLKIKIKAIPAFQYFPIWLTVARIALVFSEFWRIRKYHKLGHL